jgi:DNA-binding GntR family transcriptional regulator
LAEFPKLIQRNQPLKEQAYGVLRKAILSGELSPGQRLVEAQIAKKFQVSRTPIREAMQRLQQEGLIVPNSENVLRIATFSAEDATQLYECRIALERVSVTAACHHAKPAQMQKLQRIVQQAEKLADGKPSTLLNFQLLDVDYQFHRLLAEMSGNLWLRSMLERLFDKMMLLRIQTIQQNREVLEIRVEHRSIYEAVAQRNPDAAAEAAIAHLIAARTRVVQELQMFQPAQKNLD